MFIVLEIQSDETEVTVISNSYEERNDAEKKYFLVLAAAATSDIPIHSAVMLTQEGYYCKSESFNHKDKTKVNK